MSVDLVRIVDSIHRDKNIAKDILFEGIQSALTTAARKHYPDAAEIAGVLGRSEGAVRVLIHRALRSVARDLDDKEDPDR